MYIEYTTGIILGAMRTFKLKSIIMTDEFLSSNYLVTDGGIQPVRTCSCEPVLKIL